MQVLNRNMMVSLDLQKLSVKDCLQICHTFYLARYMIFLSNLALS